MLFYQTGRCDKEVDPICPGSKKMLWKETDKTYLVLGMGQASSLKRLNIF
jgi:hypothetical protein